MRTQTSSWGRRQGARHRHLSLSPHALSLPAFVIRGTDWRGVRAAAMHGAMRQLPARCGGKTGPVAGTGSGLCSGRGMDAGCRMLLLLAQAPHQPRGAMSWPGCRLSCWLGLCLERSSSWLHRLRLSGLHFESRAGTSVTARPNHHLQPKRTPQSHEAQSRIAKALPDIAVSVQG